MGGAPKFAPRPDPKRVKQHITLNHELEIPKQMQQTLLFHGQFYHNELHDTYNTQIRLKREIKDALECPGWTQNQLERSDQDSKFARLRWKVPASSSVNMSSFQTMLTHFSPQTYRTNKNLDLLQIPLDG